MDEYARTEDLAILDEDIRRESQLLIDLLNAEAGIANECTAETASEDDGSWERMLHPRTKTDLRRRGSRTRWLERYIEVVSPIYWERMEAAGLP